MLKRFWRRLRARLVEDWRAVLKRAWSVRLIIIAGLFDLLNAALTSFMPWFPITNPWLAFGMSVAAGLLSAAALVSRFIAQKNLNH